MTKLDKNHPGYTPPQVEPIAGDERPYIERLEDAVQQLIAGGLTGISSFIFVDHERKRRKYIRGEDGKLQFLDEWETYTVKKNATVKSMCETMAKVHGTDAELIAKDYYGMFTSPAKRIDYECRQCCALMHSSEREEHEKTCKPIRTDSTGTQHP